jgi:hypothetical protein
MALMIPKTIIKDRIAVFEAMPNSIAANFGIIVFSIPIIPPTKALR